MRKTLFSLAIVASISINLFAQSSIETQTLFDQKGKNGVYISTFFGELSPSTAWTTLNNSAGKATMLTFGIHVNRRVSIGFYLSRSPNTNVINVPVQGDANYQEWIDAGVELDQLEPGQTQAFAYFSHKGLDLNYMFKSEKTVFPRVGFKLGSGALELAAEQRRFFTFFPTIIYKTRVLDFNPEVGGGVNLTNWWRLHVDIGYHFVFTTDDSAKLNANNFDGPTLRFGFAFGAFNR